MSVKVTRHSGSPSPSLSHLPDLLVREYLKCPAQKTESIFLCSLRMSPFCSPPPSFDEVNENVSPFLSSTDEFVQHEGSDAALVCVRGLRSVAGWRRRVDRLLAVDGGGNRPAAEPDH